MSEDDEAVNSKTPDGLDVRTIGAVLPSFPKDYISTVLFASGAT